MGAESIGRVVVAGGTGLIGQRLVGALTDQGVPVTVLTRHPEAALELGAATARGWDSLLEALDGASIVVNLCGEGIAEGRWTAKRKTLLEFSRIETTERIVEALRWARQRPAVLLNASAVGFYGARDGSPLDEGSAGGSGFLARLCQKWERAADKATGYGVRVVRLRTGVVLAPEGGALPKMALPVRLFQGAVLGSGQQGLSWIHVEDLVALILEAARNPAYEGPLNATAPWPVNNRQFTHLLGRVLHRPVLPLPSFLTRGTLRLLVGEMADEMLLAGAFVYPRKALGLGFRFRFPTAESALADLLRE